MNQSNENLWSSLFALAFGICALAFLVVVDRQEWSQMRPTGDMASAVADGGTRAAQTPARTPATLRPAQTRPAALDRAAGRPAPAPARVASVDF